VGSLQQFIEHIDLAQVRIDIARAFSEVFDVNLQEIF